MVRREGAAVVVEVVDRWGKGGLVREHLDLAREAIGLFEIARGAGGDDVFFCRARKTYCWVRGEHSSMRLMSNEGGPAEGPPPSGGAGPPLLDAIVRTDSKFRRSRRYSTEAAIWLSSRVFPQTNLRAP